MKTRNEYLFDLVERHMKRQQAARSGDASIQEVARQLIDVDITCMWFLTQDEVWRANPK